MISTKYCKFYGEIILMARTWAVVRYTIYQNEYNTQLINIRVKKRNNAKHPNIVVDSIKVLPSGDLFKLVHIPNHNLSMKDN